MRYHFTPFSLHDYISEYYQRAKWEGSFPFPPPMNIAVKAKFYLIFRELTGLGLYNGTFQ